jgi:hypothetical protein
MLSDSELSARTRRLKAHVARIAGKPCQWGVDDCTRWAADWVEQERGIDLQLPAYTGEEQARALIARAGGLLPLWAGRLARAGIFETASPSYGDVGLVETKAGPVGLIFAHDGIGVWRAEVGATLLRPRRLLKAWSI